MPELKVGLTDNRDPGATWLWIEGTDDYIEVSPYDIMDDMVENCSEGIVEYTDVTQDELDLAMAILKRACS